MMRLKEVALSNASTEAKIAGLAVLLDKELLRLSEIVLNTKKLQGPQGEQGLQGPKGEQGDRGFDGTNGKDGSDGKDGKDGVEGKDGVGVQDARIDFDGSLVITLTNGREINAGDVVPEGVADKIKVIKSGGGNSQTVLDAIEEIQATIATYGTIATQDADAVAITGGSINGTTIGAAVPATGVFTTLTASALTATGQTNLGTGSANYLTAVGSAGAPALYTQGSGTNIQMSFSSKGSGNISFQTNGFAQQQLAVSHTASAVNYVQVTGAATGNAATISAQGSDSSVALFLSSKAAGNVVLAPRGLNGLIVQPDTSPVNYSILKSANTAYSPVLSTAGSDTNISQVFQSKGTGAIDLAAGSKGVNISNGGTVTAITRTNAGTSYYTSQPSCAITAPTTAGGVQATGIAVMYADQGTTVSAGGTGYTVGDTLTLVGGTPTGAAATFTVATVSAGVVLTVNAVNYSNYSVLPSSPVSTTGGTGSGCTLSVRWKLNSVTITNAGSGYVEQPTVSFSGGGGSGAAAYATVGATTTFRTIGHTGTVAMRFDVPSSLTNNIPTLRLLDSSNAQDSGVQASGGVGGAFINAFGATNATVGLFSSGTGLVSFGSGGTSQTRQLAVAHTASAVNYVQVTGAATGGAPNITAQGSDANVALLLKSKGTYACEFQSSAGTILLQALPVASSVNYLRISPSVASSAPVLSSQGSDTNIDLTLTPKGTGNVRFGTLTASADAAITGYITIKDSGGTVRKLAVIA